MFYCLNAHAVDNSFLLSTMCILYFSLLGVPMPTSITVTPPVTSGESIVL